MKRDENLDMVKGVAMILMIVGHCGFLLDWNSIGMKLIFCFHMPLFFIVCGYCLPYPMKKFDFSRQFNHLIGPYLIFSGIRVFLINLKELVRNHHFDVDCLLSAIYAAGSPKDFLGIHIDWNSPLWFLPCLFFSRWIFQTIVIQYHKKWLPLIFIFIACIGYLIGKYIWFPFSLCPAMVSTVFIFTGYLCKTRLNNFRLFSKNPFYVILSVVSVVLACFLPTFSIESLSMKYTVVHFLPAIGGTFLIYYSCSFISLYRIRKYLALIGFYSLNVLCVHSIEQIVSPFDILSKACGGGLVIGLWLAFCRVVVTLILTAMEVWLSGKINILINKYGNNKNISCLS